jgi:topoisomerase-4 subunit A
MLELEAEKEVTGVDKDEVEPVVEAKTDAPMQEQVKVEKPKSAKKVDFEITNPDDIEIDEKGQLGLF